MAEKDRLVRDEMAAALSRPWRLPKNLFLAGLFTMLGVAFSILIHTFHRGLPYISADLFVWTLATYNASQLGSDSKRVMSLAQRKKSLKHLFFSKNISLLILAIPIDLLFIVIASSILGDWSKFWPSILLGITAVTITLGIGNIISVVWVYQPVNLWHVRHDRVKIFEYLIFLTVSYIGASLSIVLAVIPTYVLVYIIKIHTTPQIIIGVAIILLWAVALWLLCLRWADNLAQNHKSYFMGRLGGESVKIKNKRAKRILKIND